MDFHKNWSCAEVSHIHCPYRTRTGNYCLSLWRARQDYQRKWSGVHQSSDPKMSERQWSELTVHRSREISAERLQQVLQRHPRDEPLDEKLCNILDDARRRLTSWRSGYNYVSPIHCWITTDLQKRVERLSNVAVTRTTRLPRQLATNMKSRLSEPRCE